MEGRLLIYEPDITLFETFPESETHGYFDGADTPPWDTWVGWIEEPGSPGRPRQFRYLVSWVHPANIELVQRGADVSTTNTLRWLDEEPCILREQLRASGAL